MKDSKVIVAINKDEEAPISRWQTTASLRTSSKRCQNCRRRFDAYSVDGSGTPRTREAWNSTCSIS